MRNLGASPEAFPAPTIHFVGASLLATRSPVASKLAPTFSNHGGASYGGLNPVEINRGDLHVDGDETSPAGVRAALLRLAQPTRTR